jgi:hypothetical protein
VDKLKQAHISNSITRGSARGRQVRALAIDPLEQTAENPLAACVIGNLSVRYIKIASSVGRKLVSRGPSF